MDLNIGSFFGDKDLEKLINKFENKVIPCIHTSITREELFLTKSRYGVYPIELLYTKNLIKNGVMLIQAGWISSWEINILSRYKTSIIISPTLNMRLGLGSWFPYLELRDKGINLCIGTENIYTTRGYNILSEVKNLDLLVRYNYWKYDFNTSELMNLITLNVAKLMNLPSGDVEVNNVANLIFINYKKFLSKCMIFHEDYKSLVSDIIYNLSPDDIEMLMLRGKVVYDEMSKHKLIDEVLDEAPGLKEG